MATTDSSFAKKRSKAANLARLLADEKWCGKCQQSKPRSEFPRSRETTDGLSRRCKSCKRIDGKRYREKNPQKMARLVADWAKRNPDRVKAKTRRFKDSAPPAYWAEKSAQWRLRNPDKAKQSRDDARRKARSTAQGLLNARMSNAIRSSLVAGKGGRSWINLVGYTIDELMSHIERQFVQGMDWQKFRSGQIHLDHIVPLSSFVFNSPSDEGFKRAWAITNLRPLWAAENMRKSAKRIFLI